MITIIRLLLTMVLIYFTYLETGPFTAGCMIFIFFALEGTTAAFGTIKIKLYELERSIRLKF